MKLHANAQTCPHCRALIVSRVLGGQTPSSVARDFRVSVKTVLKWASRFRAQGDAGLTDRTSRPMHSPNRLLQPGKQLSDAVFALLHTPPRASGFNRTSWRLEDLHAELKKQGVITTPRSIRTVIKLAGYQWKKARVTLTSADPEYREKLDALRKTLSDLRPDEAFFSVDEFGPFSIKMHGGKALMPPGSVRHIPQWQNIKGSLILTAALELSRNQTTYFFSSCKNTEETCKLIDKLRRQYHGYRRLRNFLGCSPVAFI